MYINRLFFLFCEQYLWQNNICYLASCLAVHGHTERVAPSSALIIKQTLHSDPCLRCVCANMILLSGWHGQSPPPACGAFGTVTRRSSGESPHSIAQSAAKYAMPMSSCRIALLSQAVQWSMTSNHWATLAGLPC